MKLTYLWHFWSEQLQMQVVIQSGSLPGAMKILRDSLGKILSNTFDFQFGDKVNG